ncbi:hypothetical protein [Parapedobacter koreensis]|uniref:Uncharacterized protein n=1 Tax=Parapedobacter koreensis TaxID=332977 RepID=A0A1H7HU65_9SPHI|nr:hypothetical protein [Parapedobacter koreensis]SEK53841.1 hypothetical protein SAMN05421740_10219 [Parapedobacter koreensis]
MISTFLNWPIEIGAALLFSLFSSGNVAEKPHEVKVPEQAVVARASPTKARLAIYRFTPNDASDWRNPANWQPGESSDPCGGVAIPCQVDLEEAGYPDIETMLANFTDDQLDQFLNHDGVEAKN